jgi:hypothetical protein
MRRAERRVPDVRPFDQPFSFTAIRRTPSLPSMGLQNVILPTLLATLFGAKRWGARAA